jgi:hypothetical protein
MNSWLQRWYQRHRDLSLGVDSDLVRDNRRRYKLSFGLLSVGMLLILLGTKLHSPSTVRWILVGIAAVSFLAGSFLAHWAQQEAAFLRKPAPEEPPRIFEQKD